MARLALVECSSSQTSNLITSDAVLRGVLRYGLDLHPEQSLSKPFYTERDIRSVMNVFGFTLRDVVRCLPADISIPQELLNFVEAICDHSDGKTRSDFDRDERILSYMHAFNYTLLDFCKLLPHEWSNDFIDGDIISQPACDMPVELEGPTYIALAKYHEIEAQDRDARKHQKLLDYIREHADNPNRWALETIKIENGFQVAVLKAPWGARAIAVENANRTERQVVFTARKQEGQDRLFTSGGALSLLGASYKREKQKRQADGSSDISMYQWMKTQSRERLLGFHPCLTTKLYHHCLHISHFIPFVWLHV